MSTCNFPADLIRLNDEVRLTIDTDGNASRIVALESTIISHGMPYPENVACAKELERIVRSHGAVPATIAILNGVIHIGLSDSELELLGKEGQNCLKCSRRDIPYAIAAKKNGATTVAGTILLANEAGIRVMATGGIGGVHRGGEQTMDVSADLTELGKTAVCVVSAGVKSILDIPKTLEVLETQGVPVISYQTNEFPAFFTRSSGCTAPLRLDTAEEVATFIDASLRVGLENGSVLGVPIPAAMEAEGAVIEDASARAIAECNEQKIVGRDITPFLLKRVNELTGGKSLKSNLALVQNNAGVAADIAVRLHNLAGKQVSR